MGDIDDFFAKKDKKKKGTKKFSKANTDILAKNLQETERKEQKELEKQEKDIGIPILEVKVADVLAPPDDEEWDDYRENKKDFSGLKIETLKIEEPPEEEEDETEINEDGEVVTKKKDGSGPWNKLVGSGSNGTGEYTPTQELNKEAEMDLQTPNVVGGSYVPPHMRGSGGGSTASPASDPAQMRRPAQRRNRAAPDINSEVYFPSLSSAVEDGGPKGAWGKGGGGGGGGGFGRRNEDAGGHFEEVRESGKASHNSRHTEAPKLALGNKFAALRDGD